LTFEGKIVLVTGGSRGIGKFIAEAFAESGATTIVTYRNAIDAAYFDSKGIRHYQCDVSDSKSVQELIDKIITEHQRIDVLVNNAGITKDGLLMRMSEEDWDAVIDTNLKGVFNMTKSVTRHMMGKRYGKIVNITSVVGITGNPGQSNYVASKAGVIGFTKATAKELASRNININAIAPGFIGTEMTDKLSDEVKAKYLEIIPLKRIGSGRNIADVVMFLSSDMSEYITGQTICVDGGLVM
jgi:3-oxoacyl-[acyl-carrier protein] reductase